ncbi:FecR family protein [Hydrogenophaga sp. 5NK40-0174]|uniref:FecR family protein n=1 Tax=Hydrogenophaga sp. 5NK40-0174 TaxID=3127649 RepID=UPI003103CCF0
MNSSHLPHVTALRRMVVATTLCATMVSLPALAQDSTPSAASAPAEKPATSAAAAADTASASARIGTVKRVEGEVLIGREGDMRKPAPGEGILLSDRLTTGKNGAASLMLKDGTVLTMGPDTTMDLSQYAFDSTTQKGNFLLDLLEGSVRVVTGLLGKANPDLFKVSTPTSVVGVRGTDFIVETQEK